MSISFFQWYFFLQLYTFKNKIKGVTPSHLFRRMDWHMDKASEWLCWSCHIFKASSQYIDNSNKTTCIYWLPGVRKGTNRGINWIHEKFPPSVKSAKFVLWYYRPVWFILFRCIAFYKIRFSTHNCQLYFPLNQINKERLNQLSSTTGRRHFQPTRTTPLRFPATGNEMTCGHS